MKEKGKDKCNYYFEKQYCLYTGITQLIGSYKCI